MAYHLLQVSHHVAEIEIDLLVSDGSPSVVLIRDPDLEFWAASFLVLQMNLFQFAMKLDEEKQLWTIVIICNATINVNPCSNVPTATFLNYEHRMCNISQCTGLKVKRLIDRKETR